MENSLKTKNPGEGKLTFWPNPSHQIVTLKEGGKFLRVVLSDGETGKTPRKQKN